MDQHPYGCFLQRKTSLGVSLTALLIILGPVRTAEPAPMGMLSGKVLGPDGEPAIGARVWADTYSGRRLAEARTDTEGRFRLGPVEPVYRHRFDLLVEADGFARQYVPRGTYSIFPGTNCDLGTIRLDRGRVFTGQVLDVDGRPRPDASVECRLERYILGHTVDSIGPAWPLTTDAEGRFRTPPLPVGRLYLKVRVPERQMSYVLRPIQPGGEETLEPIRLEEDVPIPGIVSDEQGRPIAGATIRANDIAQTTSDAAGKFVLRGFGPTPQFQMQVHKNGYILINNIIIVDEDGFRWVEDGKPSGAVKDLTVTMEPLAWIEGRALDAETGEPVRLDKVVLCFFERRPDGEVVLGGCRDSDFEQPEPGRFRVAYSYPDEYHLTLSAAGYHDAEAFTPKVTERKTIEGIVVKLKKQEEGTRPEVPRQMIAGTVTRDGRPIQTGWVGLWALRQPDNSANAPILRGRTVVQDPIVYASAPIRGGAYAIDVPFQGTDWYVVVEEPGQPLTQVGPIPIGLNQEKRLDIACTEGGRISGRVKDVPRGWEGHLWVVAFTRTAIRVEARVAPDGEFSLPLLPPGEYGLKVGHDAYDDSEVPRDRNIPEEEWERLADPWRRAKVVEVEAGRDSGGVEVELPQ